jgi:hypothetical protein
MLDDYMQVRGGRGYERATSLYERGDRPVGLEMAMRDMRVGRIFEGSSEVMHLIMAREALDTHFKLVMPIIMPKPGQKEGKISLLMKAAAFYATWLPKVFMPVGAPEVRKLNSANRGHLHFAAKTCKRLARNLFFTMGKYQAKMEYEQIILGNFVDIGTDLFVMAATLSYADSLLSKNPADQTPQELADLFCREARKRIEANFKAVKSNHNKSYKKVANLLMDGELSWLADGGMDNPIPPAYRDYAKNDYEHPCGRFVPPPEKPKKAK